MGKRKREEGAAAAAAAPAPAAADGAAPEAAAAAPEAAAAAPAAPPKPKAPTITRKWRQQTAVGRDGLPAVIIRGTGEIIPVENLFLKQKHAAATGVPLARFEECWVCGSTDHRRRDCPTGDRRDDGSLIQATVVCLGCRRRGHRLADCPDRSTLAGGGAGGGGAGAAAPGWPSGAQQQQQPQSQGFAAAAAAALCYRCGESHHLRDCPAPKRDGSLPFAHCFVCGRSGHLASACPDNKQGVYPRGGSCKVCQSTAHLAKDCPVEAAAGGRQPSARWPGGGGGGGAPPPRAHTRGRGRDTAPQDGGGEEEAQQPLKRAAFQPGIFVASAEDLGGQAFASETIKRSREQGEQQQHGRGGGGGRR